MKQHRLVLATCLALAFAAPAAMAEESHAHWGYEGHAGPSHWGELSNEYATCLKGQQQSPIDIKLKDAARAAVPAISVHYQAAPLDVINNGHTIQVNLPKGSTISVGDKTYDLVQFHFHAPSEHTLDGKHSDMVIHFVHKTADGQLGVIGVLMNKGAANAGLKTIWDHLPEKSGDRVQLSKESVDPAALLPADLTYVGYSGSLTTPPCTEGVSWMVMTHTTTVSAEQLSKFTALFPHNNRPVQPRHHRSLQLSGPAAPM